MKTTSSKILIVDDDEGVRSLLFDCLSDQYMCVTASSGTEALSLVTSERPALVISDIAMPGLNGFDLLPRVRELSPETVTMIVSGDHTIDTAVEAIRAGAFDLIHKPFQLDQVEVAVSRAIAYHLLLAEKGKYEKELERLVDERTSRLAYLAYHDELTGLPNRTWFQRKLAGTIRQLQPGRYAAVVLISPHRFRSIRATIGHGAGDELLAAAAARLAAFLPDQVTLARIDTEEFALLLPDGDGPDHFRDVLIQVGRVTEALFEMESQRFNLAFAMGVSVYPTDASSESELMRNASVALEAAARVSQTSHQFYTPEMAAAANRRLRLEFDLRDALEKGQFRLFYQAKLDTVSGRPVGMEALIRWNHPELGDIAPDEFIGIAEETGEIVRIGKWVLEEGARRTAAWNACGLDLNVAINVSSVQCDAQFVQIVRAVLAESGLDPKKLNLEVTESAVMGDAIRGVELLYQLKELGIGISIDDFGMGYSSLGQLKKLPIDVVKIDKSFIRDVTTDPNDASLVMGIIGLAHNLGLKVVAEGVETEGQLGLLRLLRCDQWQGYLFSRPLPPDEFERLIRLNENLNIEPQLTARIPSRFSSTPPPTEHRRDDRRGQQYTHDSETCGIFTL